MLYILSIIDIIDQKFNDCQWEKMFLLLVKSIIDETELSKKALCSFFHCILKKKCWIQFTKV